MLIFWHIEWKFWQNIIILLADEWMPTLQSHSDERQGKKERERKGDETERERETDISTDMAYFTLARGHILFD